MAANKKQLSYVISIVILVVLGLNSQLLAEALTGGPYVLTPALDGSGVPDATKANIVWYTDTTAPGSPDCKIDYRPTGTTTWMSVMCSGSSARPGNCPNLPGVTVNMVTRYELQIVNLNTGSTYEYRLYGNGSVPFVPSGSDPYPVFQTIKKITPTTPITDVEFFAFGDSGSNPNTIQQTMATTIANLCPQADFGLHVGDIIYPSTKGDCTQSGQWCSGACQGYPSMYFQPYRSDIKEITIYTTLGNHDSDDYCPGGLCCTGSDWCTLSPMFLCPKGCPASTTPPPYLNSFSLPTNGPNQNQDPLHPADNPDINKRNYYFDYGNARFITIDSNATGKDLTGDPMYTNRANIKDWLGNVLSSTPSNYWKFTRWK